MKVDLNKEIVARLDDVKKCYNSSKAVNNDLFRVIAEPFKVIKLNEVVNDKNFISSLREATQSLELNEKNNDLYSLKQSDSLLTCSDPTVIAFIKLLKRKIQPALEHIFGYKFNQTISVTASLYQYGDVLLCHDDRCEDRCVAFVYYLNSIGKEDGGTFDMFQHDPGTEQPTDIVESIPPREDCLVCFEVGNYTYHQVSEVVSKNGMRLSINGWFHSERALSMESIQYRQPLPTLHHQLLLEGLILLDEFIRTVHFTPSYVDQVRERFCSESQVLLTDFLNKSFYSLCQESLASPNIRWLNKGPANRRKYEVADAKTVRGVLSTLVDFVKSSLFVSYLRSITGLSLEPLTGTGRSSRLVAEVQRWTSGCYTMATDNDCFFDHDGLDVFLFFNTEQLEGSTEECGGAVVYLDAAPDEGSSNDDRELLTIEPVKNSLCAVYRTSDTIRFIKYLNNRFSGTYYCIAATYYELDQKLETNFTLS